MNYGMIAIYTLWAMNLLSAANMHGRKGIDFWYALLSVVVSFTLLAWSHGWRVTW